MQPGLQRVSNLVDTADSKPTTLVGMFVVLVDVGSIWMQLENELDSNPAVSVGCHQQNDQQTLPWCNTQCDGDSFSTWTMT